MIYRYIKNTIKKQHWEILLDGTTLTETQVSKDGGEVVRQKIKHLTPAQAEQYKERNKIYLIETITP